MTALIFCESLRYAGYGMQAKVLSSFYVSRIFGKPVQWGFPISISFEPTTSCNLRCPECPSGLRAFTQANRYVEKGFFQANDR